jgi:hypothetical protein
MIIKTKDMPFNDLISGKNIFLDIEGSGKTTSTILNQLISTKQNAGLTFCNTFTTIDMQVEKYNYAIREAEKLGISKEKVILIKSSSEMVRETIKDKDPLLHKKFKKETPEDRKTTIEFISLKKGSYCHQRQYATYPGEKDYEYQVDGNNLKRSFNQLNRKFGGNFKSSCSNDFIVVVNHHGGEYKKFGELINKLNFCTDGYNPGKSKFSTSILSRRLMDPKMEFDKLSTDDEKYFILDRSEVNEVRQKIKEMKLLEQDIIKNPSNYKDCIIFYQNEKFYHSFVNLKNKYIFDNFRLMYDEFPINKTCLNILDTIADISRVLILNPEDREIKDNDILKCFDKKKIKKLERDVRNGDDIVEDLEIDVQMYLNPNKNSYLRPRWTWKPTGASKLNKILTLFKNICILSTEKAPAEFMSHYGFKCYEKERDISTILSKNIKVYVLNNECDTTKKHEPAMKKFVSKTKGKGKLVVGKRSLDCDTTLEALKGSNKIYQDKDLKKISLFISPIHPDEPYELFEKTETNALEDVAIQRRTDDLNQFFGRHNGLRGLYREEMGLGDISTDVYISACDKISMIALRRSRYFNKDIVIIYI